MELLGKGPVLLVLGSKMPFVQAEESQTSPEVLRDLKILSSGKHRRPDGSIDLAALFDCENTVNYPSGTPDGLLSLSSAAVGKKYRHSDGSIDLAALLDDEAALNAPNPTRDAAKPYS